MPKPICINRTKDSRRHRREVLLVDLCVGVVVFALIALLVYLLFG
jgi:hypothetical protein